MAYEFRKQERPVWKITFSEPIVKKVMGGVELKTTELEIKKVIDNPATKQVAALVEGNELYVLWSGEAYDNIGNWTNENVETRLREMIANGITK
mgnify:CR=1 FL=1